MKPTFRMTLLIAWVFLFLMYLVVSPAFAAPVSGVVTRVIDGDTLQINNTRIRLWGIDAFESSQKCTDSRGQVYPCGQVAKSTLTGMVLGKRLSCSQKDIDRYGRTVAVCRLDRNDIGGRMVELGWAIHYASNETYLDREKEAQGRKAGAWNGTFATPIDYRIARNAGTA